MSDVLHDLSRVQAARPTCHWWRCPRLLAWFRVLMVVSLVKRPTFAGLLSRIGDYLLLQHEGLGSDDNRTDSVWHGHHQRRPSTVGTMTRSPPQPLFHRRRLGGAPSEHQEGPPHRRYSHGCTPWYSFRHLFDHLIRLEEERRGDGEVERLGGLQVDNQLEIPGRFHRQVRPAWRL